MRMGSAEARKSGRETRPSRKAPLKPKNGLNGPPANQEFYTAADCKADWHWNWCWSDRVWDLSRCPHAALVGSAALVDYPFKRGNSVMELRHQTRFFRRSRMEK